MRRGWERVELWVEVWEKGECYLKTFFDPELCCRMTGSGKGVRNLPCSLVPHNLLPPECGLELLGGLIWKPAPFVTLLPGASEVSKQLSGTSPVQETRGCLHFIDNSFVMIGLPTLGNFSSPQPKWSVSKGVTFSYFLCLVYALHIVDTPQMWDQIE